MELDYSHRVLVVSGVGVFNPNKSQRPNRTATGTAKINTAGIVVCARNIKRNLISKATLGYKYSFIISHPSIKQYVQLLQLNSTHNRGKREMKNKIRQSQSKPITYKQQNIGGHTRQHTQNHHHHHPQHTDSSSSSTAAAAAAKPHHITSHQGGREGGGP